MADAAPANQRRGNLADFRLTVAGVDITDKARPRLKTLTLTEKRGGEADDLSIALDDSDGKLAIPPGGATITLQLGWAGGGDVQAGLIDKGSFVVDTAEWQQMPGDIKIRARSADLTGAARTRTEATHADTTLGTVARQIAGAHGWQARIDPGLDAIAVPILTQHQESDLALLRRLGREHDAVATIKHATLILSPIGKGATPAGKTLPTLLITPAVGSGGRYRTIDRSNDAGAEARWHDQDSGTRKTVTAGGGGAGTRRRVRKVYHTEADATAAAQAAASRAARAGAEFEYSLGLGRPDLMPEMPVTLAGFKPEIDARAWLITELTHQLAAGSGLVTSVKLETK